MSATVTGRVRRVLRKVGLPWQVLALLLALPVVLGFAEGDGPCGAGLAELTLPDGTVLCSHGPDTAPNQPASSEPDGSDTVAHGASPNEPVASLAPQCYGQGADGARVEVLYTHEAGTADRSATLDADLRRWAGQVEWTVLSSAATTGDRRHVRFVTEAGDRGCRVAITPVTLPGGAFESFNATLSALADAGFTRSDRKYLLFADVDHGLCGLATVPNDDRKVSDNRANTAVGYARVDADCWTTGDAGYYSVAAHELVHTLGGVQLSAPNATEARHCTDEYDVLCYADGSGVTASTVCQDADTSTYGDADTNNRLLDCGGDDYFHTAPPAGSYLAEHWNTADSVFLAKGTSDGPGAVDDTQEVAPDAEGRPMVWSGPIGKAVKPLLPDAHGWESCDLPITVLVDDGTTSGGGTLDGLLGGGGSTSSSVLRDAVERAATTLEAGTRVNLFDVDASSWDGRAVDDGTLVVRWSDLPVRHHVEVTTSGARIVQGALALDAGLAKESAPTRELFVLQGLVRALGVGLTDTSGELTSRYPTVGADRSTAMAALKHLYATSCTKDARLDDTVAGPASQRIAAGQRLRTDLAAQATDTLSVGVHVSGWLSRQRGSGWASRAVVCRSDVHADCLAGTALVGDRGPVLYVPGGEAGRLPATVRGALVDAMGTGARVYVLGGTAAVSEQVVSELRSALPGRSVQRVSGGDRYDTAAEVARAIVADGGSARTVLLSRADQPADAVAAGAGAAEQRVPVLLTAPDLLPAATTDVLGDLGARNVLVTGGSAAVSDGVVGTLRDRGLSVTRLAGRDRFETAVAIARSPALWHRTEVRRSGSVIGLNGGHPETWNLALAAAPVGAYLDAPVLFTTVDTLPSMEASGGSPGGTLQQLRNLGFSGQDPEVNTVFVGAGTWADRATAEAFHARALPGYGGNVTVTAR